MTVVLLHCFRRDRTPFLILRKTASNKMHIQSKIIFSPCLLTQLHFGQKKLYFYLKIYGKKRRNPFSKFLCNKMTWHISL